MSSAADQAHRILDELATGHFFGSVTFQFKAGEVSLIRKEETILPKDTKKPDYGRTGDWYEPSKRR